jgi:hypothetical protein
MANEKDTMADEKEWTIMVYMAGDNNLSEDMITGLKGMVDFGEQEKVNLVALYDGSYPASGIKFYNFTKKMNFAAFKGFAGLERFVEDLVVPNAQNFRKAAPKNDLLRLKDFVPCVVNQFPAKKYALILSGHSDGVIGKTLLRDENPEISLNLISLRKVLEKAFKKTTKKIKKLDLIGFDGCLMGMLEVGYELKNVAKIMVASEGNIPTTGWAYQDVLSDIIANPQQNEKDFAVSIVEKYADFNVDYAISGRSVNISAFCLEELNKKQSIFTLVQELALVFNDLLNLPTEATDLVSPQTASENQLIKEKFIEWILLSHYRSQVFMHSQAVDIIDFTYNLLLHYPKWLRENEILGFIAPKTGTKKTENTTINRVEGEIDKIFKKFIAMNKAIKDLSKQFILASCSVGAEYQFSQGVSVFFPWTTLALNLIHDKYTELKFNKPQNWLNFITSLSSFTFRQYKTQPVFAKNIESLFALSFASLSHKEVGKKEVGKKEVGKKGSIEEFYLYFSQFQNYDPEVFEKHPTDTTSFI